MDVAEVFIGERMTGPASAAPAAEPPAGERVPAEARAAYVGDYESRELRTIHRVAAGADGLVIAFGEAPALALLSLGDDLMRAGPMEAEFHFHRDAADNVVGFTLSSGAGRVRNLAFPRLP
jgi:hypothetical protein